MPRREVPVATVYAIIIWLRDSGLVPLDEGRAETIGSGHRSFVFNAPALPRVRYAHFEDRDEAEATLRNLAQQIDAGRTILVRAGVSSFAIPARSVHYVALSEGEADQVNERSSNPA